MIRAVFNSVVRRSLSRLRITSTPFTDSVRVRFSEIVMPRDDTGTVRRQCVTRVSSATWLAKRAPTVATVSFSG